jgi:DNA topoisomerase-1
MVPAVYDTVSAKISSGEYIFKASGSVLKFAGYKAIFKKDDEDKSEPSLMAELSEGEKLKLLELSPEQHFTQPPPRFSEAMLVKTLEENGVGRPSTYAPTISTIIARRYVIKENKMLYPTELGEIVNDIMKNNFEDIVSIDFTAKMEEDLDKVEDGEKAWKDVIRQFYPPFSEQIEEAENKIGEIEIKDEETDVVCENCGRNMVIKYGKFGKFLACPGFPECRNTLPFYEEAGVNCPLCSEKVLIKKTRKGRKYFGCANNPECSFVSWHKPTGERCPQCGDILIEKGTKNRKIHCSNAACGYIKEIENEE